MIEKRYIIKSGRPEKYQVIKLYKFTAKQGLAEKFLLKCTSDNWLSSIQKLQSLIASNKPFKRLSESGLLIWGNICRSLFFFDSVLLNLKVYKISIDNAPSYGDLGENGINFF